MHIARFRYRGNTLSGEVIEESLIKTPNGSKLSLEEVVLLPPCNPTKIVCVGRNYADHAAELGLSVPNEPLLFLKPPTAIIPTGGEIEYPRYSNLIHYEGELAIVIGKRCRNVSSTHAIDVIAGYTIMNDVTARDVQRTDGQWTRGKAFDTSAPLGPWLTKTLDIYGISIRTWVNQELRQNGTPRDFVFRIENLISYISRVMTLEPGDVIATGTPAGVGELKIGDTVEIAIDGIGSLTNTVIASPTEMVIS